MFQSSERYNDGEWHTLTANRASKTGKLELTREENGVQMTESNNRSMRALSIRWAALAV